MHGLYTCIFVFLTFSFLCYRYRYRYRYRSGSIIIPNHNETRCLQPKSLQVALDYAMKQVSGRCFVRPSGTENVVRIYAEAATRQDADWLAAESAKLAHQYCHGIGELPKIAASKL
jgi:phosphoacetylglucosamine mutase